MKSIILAGGIGSRLHPVSTEDNPKQFLKLATDQSILKETLDRVQNFSEDIHISSRKKWKDKIQSDTQFTEEKLIFEPIGKNTGPAIAYCISKFDDDDIVGFFPSDHHIHPVDEFVKSVRQAESLIQQHDTVVLFGIEPRNAHTGLGYLHVDDQDILSFKEKPDLETAQQYVEDGNYLWNSGMFFFRVGKMKELFNEHSPEIGKWIDDGAHDEAFHDLEPVSIDYAVMEKAQALKVVPCSFLWSDLGSFEEIESVSGLTKEDLIQKCG